MGVLLVVCIYIYMAVSENSGTPKSSILVGFSIINYKTIHFGVPLVLETAFYEEFVEE